MDTKWRKKERRMDGMQGNGFPYKRCAKSPVFPTMSVFPWVKVPKLCGCGKDIRIDRLEMHGGSTHTNLVLETI